MTPSRREGDTASDLDARVARAMRRRSRRSFLGLGLAAATGFAGWEWVTAQREIGGVPYPLRRVLEFNERLAECYFNAARLAPTFPRALAREPRVNGGEGLSAGFDPSAWRLELSGTGDRRTLALDEIRQLPRVEMTTELMCIEGWSVIVNWTGARVSDLAAKVNVPTGSNGARNRRARPGTARYVALKTPDEGYYVALDMESALHPQTLLCYEMNGQPLTLDHGAPLRLVAPVKYGIKSLKRIGSITFTDQRPLDFWADRGYDWYAGL